MNLLLAQGLLAGGGKFFSVIQAILTEVSPAITTLGPDVAQLVTDGNKALADLQAVFDKLKVAVAAKAAS